VHRHRRPDNAVSRSNTRAGQSDDRPYRIRSGCFGSRDEIGVPELKKDKKSKIRRAYTWYAKPWEILRQLPGLAGYLKENITVEQLERIAGAESDIGAAMKMPAAKEKDRNKKWKSKAQDSRFPTVPLSNRPRPDRFASGSSVNEKMLEARSL
jgi:hypothetical protein